MPKQMDLSPSVFKGGISEKRLKERAARQKAAEGGGKTIRYKTGETRLVQFWGEPSDDNYFLEFHQHQFQDGGKWNYVPCRGVGSAECEPCQSEMDQKSKVHNRVIIAVWSFKDRAPKILEGPMGMAQAIFHQYKRSPDNFLRRTFEITKMDTQPVTYNVDRGEERPLNLSGKTPEPLLDYLKEQLERYYADIKVRPSTLDDDEEEDETEDVEDEDDEETEDDPTESEMMDKEEWGWQDLNDYARTLGVQTDTNKRSVLVERIIRKRDR